MSSDAQRIAQGARQQLADHLRDFLKEAPGFIDGYAEHMVSGARHHRGTAHPLLVKLAKDLVAEEYVNDRMMGRRAA